MDTKAMQKQAEEIAKVNAALQKNGNKFTVLQSAEVNLSTDGVGMKTAALNKLDSVLGSFH